MGRRLRTDAAPTFTLRFRAALFKSEHKTVQAAESHISILGTPAWYPPPTDSAVLRA